MVRLLRDISWLLGDVDELKFKVDNYWRNIHAEILAITYDDIISRLIELNSL